MLLFGRHIVCSKHDGRKEREKREREREREREEREKKLDGADLDGLVFQSLQVTIETITVH